MTLAEPRNAASPTDDSRLTDRQALARWVAHSDASAFAGLVARYQAMVFATCVRVLGDRTDAEDAAQETFFKLARSAASVRGSLPAWLHTTATGTSIDIVRKRGSDRRRDTSSARAHTQAAGGDTSAEHTWSEVAPILDKALSTLPEKEHAAVVGHFLSGRSQADLAADAGVAPGTMSRTIASGLERLRKALTRQGVAISSAAALAAALGFGSASVVAPASLHAAIAGAALGGASTPPVPVGLLLAQPRVVALVAAAGTLLVGSAGWLALSGPSAPTPPPPAPSAVVASSAGSQTIEAATGVDRPRRASRSYVMLDQRVDGTIIGAFTLRITPTTFEFIGVPDDEDSTGPSRTVLTRRADGEPIQSPKALKNAETMKIVVHDIGPEADRPAMIGRLSTLYWETRGEMMLTRMVTDAVAGGSDTLFWRRAQASPAADPADPLAGEWTQIPAWWSMRMDADEIILEGGGGEYGELNGTEKPFQMVRYRVMTWERGDEFTRIEAICGNNQIAPKMIGKRVKLLLRSVGGEYELAIREFSAPPSDVWPTFHPKPGDRVLIARFGRELR